VGAKIEANNENSEVLWHTLISLMDVQQAKIDNPKEQMAAIEASQERMVAPMKRQWRSA
jgi:hypothetical protein